MHFQIKNILKNNHFISELTNYNIEREKKVIGYIYKTQAKKKLHCVCYKGERNYKVK